MPPKKSKEQTFTIAELADTFGNQGFSFAEDEAEFMPSFNKNNQQPSFSSGPRASQDSWSSGGFSNMPPRAELPIPDHAPFSARFGNLSFDVTENDLTDFLESNNLKFDSIRLPRGIDGRIRGNSYIDFSTRDDLVEALKLSGQQLMGRNLFVSVAEGRQQDFEWGQRGSVPQPRQPRFTNDYNWGEREAPPKRQPNNNIPSFDNWGERQQIDKDNVRPYKPMARKPLDANLDWSDRAAPPTAPPSAPRAHRNTPRFNKFQDDSPRDWSARDQVTPKPKQNHFSSFDAKPQETKKQEETKRVKAMKTGFNVLSEDD